MRPKRLKSIKIVDHGPIARSLFPIVFYIDTPNSRGAGRLKCERLKIEKKTQKLIKGDQIDGNFNLNLKAVIIFEN